MTQPEIEHELTQILQDVLGNERAVFARDKGPDDYPEWDSMARIDMIVAVENQFGFKFTLREIETFKTLGDLLEIVRQHVKA